MIYKIIICALTIAFMNPVTSIAENGSAQVPDKQEKHEKQDRHREYLRKKFDTLLAQAKAQNSKINRFHQLRAKGFVIDAKASRKRQVHVAIDLIP
jgi:hypothetical protein